MERKERYIDSIMSIIKWLDNPLNDDRQGVKIVCTQEWATVPLCCFGFVRVCYFLPFLGYTLCY